MRSDFNKTKMIQINNKQTRKNKQMRTKQRRSQQMRTKQRRSQQMRTKQRKKQTRKKNLDKSMKNMRGGSDVEPPAIPSNLSQPLDEDYYADNEDTARHPAAAQAWADEEPPAISSNLSQPLDEDYYAENEDTATTQDAAEDGGLQRHTIMSVANNDTEQLSDIMDELISDATEAESQRDAALERVAELVLVLENQEDKIKWVDRQNGWGYGWYSAYHR